MLTSVCLLTGICRTLPWWLRARDPPQVHTHWLSASPPRLHLARNYDNQFSVIFQLTFVHPNWRTERKKQASLSYRFVGRREIPLLKECVWFWKEDGKILFSAEERRLGWNDLRSLLVEWFKLSWRSVGGQNSYLEKKLMDFPGGIKLWIMNLIVYNLLKIISNSDASCVQCRQQKKSFLFH